VATRTEDARARDEAREDTAAVAKRSYGSGSLLVREDKRGRETWYAKVRVGGRQSKRAIGPKREPGSRHGLTRSQAEGRLRKLLDELALAPPVLERLTVEEAGARYLAHLTAIGRRRSTLGDYESYLRVQLVPFFGDLPLDKIARSHVEALIAEKIADGRAPKSVRNYVGLLHGVFVHAERQGWRAGNPCKAVELPAAPDEDAEIRFLDDAEVEALLRATPADGLGPLDRVLYLTAAMTGLRRASCSRCAGGTSTGPPLGSGCARATCGGSSAGPSRSAPRARSRSPRGSRGNSSATSRRPSGRATTTSSRTSRVQHAARPLGSAEAFQAKPRARV
jgi:hypothetical protein